jgi:hypothetical protein
MVFIPKKTARGPKEPVLGGEASLRKMKQSLKGPSSMQRDPLLGGEASLAKVMASLRKPVQIKEQKKEEKKDLSAFQGKLYLKRDEVKRWLKRDEAWKITKIPLKNRPSLEKKLFNPKRFGSFIDKREAGIVYKDFESYPERVKKRYAIKGKNERVRTFKLLKKFLGK